MKRPITLQQYHGEDSLPVRIIKGTIVITVLGIIATLGAAFAGVAFLVIGKP